MAKNILEFVPKTNEAIDEHEISHFKSLLEEKRNLELTIKAVEVSVAKHFQFCAKKYNLTNEKDSINLDDGVITRFVDEENAES